MIDQIKDFIAVLVMIVSVFSLAALLAFAIVKSPSILVIFGLYGLLVWSIGRGFKRKLF